MESNTNPDNAEQQTTVVRIMHLLNVSAKQYDAYKIRCGRIFLQNLLHHYPQKVDEMLDKQIYWNWWEQHYRLRDTVFLNAEDLHCINTQILGSMYTALHNPYTLPAELKLDCFAIEGLSFTQKPAV